MSRTTKSSNASVRGNINEPSRRILGAGNMTRDESDLSPNEFVNYYKKYYANEDKNYHSENVVLSAKLFGTPEQLAQAKSIKERHDEFGSLTPELAKERDTLERKLAVQMAKQILITSQNDPEGYDRILRASNGDYRKNSGTIGGSARSEVNPALEVPRINSTNIVNGGQNTYNKEIANAMKTPLGSQERKTLSRELLKYSVSLSEQKFKIVDESRKRELADKSKGSKKSPEPKYYQEDDTYSKPVRGKKSYLTKEEKSKLKEINSENLKLNIARKRLTPIGS